MNLDTKNHADDDERRAHAKGLKLHMRLLSVHGFTFRVATLRAGTAARFSMNYFHDTWHILTDAEGAQVLGRLLWALSFQRLSGTCVLICGPHLSPTPFEADPALPILLMQDGLARIDADLLVALRGRLRDDATGTTIRFHTFGMPDARRERDDARDQRRYTWTHDDMRALRAREKMQRLGGFIVYSAPPGILREQALTIHAMEGNKWGQYHYLAGGKSHHSRHAPEGEVQVFDRFKDMVSAARVARHEVLGPIRSRKPRILNAEDERARVQRRAEWARERLDRARGSCEPTD